MPGKAGHIICYHIVNHNYTIRLQARRRKIACLISIISLLLIGGLSYTLLHNRDEAINRKESLIRNEPLNEEQKIEKGSDKKSTVS